MILIYGAMLLPIVFGIIGSIVNSAKEKKETPISNSENEKLSDADKEFLEYENTERLIKHYGHSTPKRSSFPLCLITIGMGLSLGPLSIPVYLILSFFFNIIEIDRDYFWIMAAIISGIGLIAGIFCYFFNKEGYTYRDSFTHLLPLYYFETLIITIIIPIVLAVFIIIIFFALLWSIGKVITESQ